MSIKKYCLVFNLVLKRSVEVCLFATTSLATMRNKVSCIVLKENKKFCPKLFLFSKNFVLRQKYLFQRKQSTYCYWKAANILELFSWTNRICRVLLEWEKKLFWQLSFCLSAFKWEPLVEERLYLFVFWKKKRTL